MGAPEWFSTHAGIAAVRAGQALMSTPWRAAEWFGTHTGRNKAGKKKRKSAAENPSQFARLPSLSLVLYRAEVLGPRPVYPMWSSVNGDCSRFCGSWVFTTTALLFCQRGYPGYDNLGLSVFLVLHMVTCLNVGFALFSK